MQDHVAAAAPLPAARDLHRRRPCAADGRGTVRVAPPDQAELERLLQLMHCRRGFGLADWRQTGSAGPGDVGSVPGELAKHWLFWLDRLTPDSH